MHTCTWRSRKRRESNIRQSGTFAMPQKMVVAAWLINGNARVHTLKPLLIQMQTISTLNLYFSQWQWSSYMLLVKTRLNIFGHIIMIWGTNRRQRIVSQRVTCLLVYSYTTASTYIGLLEPTLRETTTGSEQYIVFPMQSGSVTKLSRTHKGWNHRLVIPAILQSFMYCFFDVCWMHKIKYQAPY